MRREPIDRNLGRIAATACALLVTALPLHATAADAPTKATARNAAKAKPVWVQAAAKHGGSGVSLRYSLPDALQANLPATLQLQFSGVGQDDARVELRAPAGSTLTDASGAAVTALALTPGQTTTLSLTVTASADGMQFIDVFTTQGGRSTAQSVPLKVGKGELALKKTGTLRVEPNGERVVSMPAQ